MELLTHFKFLRGIKLIIYPVGRLFYLQQTEDPENKACFMPSYEELRILGFGNNTPQEYELLVKTLTEEKTVNKLDLNMVTYCITPPSEIRKYQVKFLEIQSNPRFRGWVGFESEYLAREILKM